MTNLNFKGLYNLKERGDKRDNINDSLDKSDIIDPLKKSLPSNVGTGAIQKKADEIKRDHARAKRIYDTYNTNRDLSQDLRIELMRGVREGQNIYILFLKAIKTIDLLASDPAFYNTIENDIKLMHANIFKVPQAMEIEALKVKERLNKLNEALETETNQSARDRLKRAIKDHERQIKELY